MWMSFSCGLPKDEQGMIKLLHVAGQREQRQRVRQRGGLLGEVIRLGVVVRRDSDLHLVDVHIRALPRLRAT